MSAAQPELSSATMSIEEMKAFIRHCHLAYGRRQDRRTLGLPGSSEARLDSLPVPQFSMV